MQIGWGELEPEEGVYRWGAIDGAAKAAARAGKKVTLHVLPLPLPPPWLAQAGATMYDATSPRGQAESVPVPWDAVYLATFSGFLQTLARHLRDAGLARSIAAVSVAAPVPEMSLFPCNRGALVPGVGYDRAAYLAAWTQMIDAYEAAFPSVRKLVSAPVDVICAPDRDPSFYREVMGYALPRGSFWLFAADLNANGSRRMTPYKDMIGRASLAYQTIWSAAADPAHRMEGRYPGNLEQAVCRGLADGARHFELYPVDILSSNATLQAAVAAVHSPRSCR